MKRARGQDGFSLVALVAATTIMLILMGAAVPSWRYVMKNMREEELLFRGTQIAEAIERYQRKHAGAPPPSLEVLVKGHFLRKEWKDPMARDGKWRLLRPGDAPPIGGFGGVGGVPRPAPMPPARQAEIGGGIMGVASRNTDKSYRVFNGRSRYNEWFFMAGQPRVVGKLHLPGGMIPMPPGGGPVGPPVTAPPTPGPGDDQRKN